MLTQRRVGRRMSRQQRRVAVQQRDPDPGLGIGVAVEVLEVVDQASGAGDAEELAHGSLEPAADRKHESAGVRGVKRLADREEHAAVVAQALERRHLRDVHLVDRLRRDDRRRQPPAIRIEQHETVDLHQPDRLFLEVGVQGGGVEPVEQTAAMLLGQVPQHRVDRLQAARSLLGDHP